jgi:hypothetical protein
MGIPDCSMRVPHPSPLLARVGNGGGYGIHWPEIDEDISTEGLLREAPAPQGGKSS